LAVAQNFGSLVFTPGVKALQEKYGSRRHYARMESGGTARDRLGADETAFIADRDSFYIATVSADGWLMARYLFPRMGCVRRSKTK
jgi:hypothetical protein